MGSYMLISWRRRKIWGLSFSKMASKSGLMHQILKAWNLSKEKSWKNGNVHWVIISFGHMIEMLSINMMERCLSLLIPRDSRTWLSLASIMLPNLRKSSPLKLAYLSTLGTRLMAKANFTSLVRTINFRTHFMDRKRTYTVSMVDADIAQIMEELIKRILPISAITILLKTLLMQFTHSKIRCFSMYSRFLKMVCLTKIQSEEKELAMNLRERYRS